MNRRELMIGAAATAAVASLPFPAPATILQRNPVLESVLGMLKDGYGHPGKPGPLGDWDYNINAIINTKLITKYPYLFPQEEHIFSRCPCNLFTDGNERVAVVVASRMYQTAYTAELISDLKAINGCDAEEEFSNLIVDELAHELLLRKIKAIDAGNKIFSYIPVAIDRTSYWARRVTPEVKFKSRYAVTAINHRILEREIFPD